MQDVWSLCRVFLGDDETPNSNKLQELVNSDRASHSTHSVVPRVEDRGSTSKPRVENVHLFGTTLFATSFYDADIV